ncbi:hypothetical protein [Photobacterium sp. 53610]|uniref:hypothetical protein n=1 Tax=Photobacterium sp. 53610 TaxID=3102789 RepID=UPI002EDB21EF
MLLYEKLIFTLYFEIMNAGINYLFVVIFSLTLVGCESFRSIKSTPYNPPKTGAIAEVKFQQSTPFIYGTTETGIEPDTSLMSAAIQYGFADFKVFQYDDSQKCTDYQELVSDRRLSGKTFMIKADELATFQLRPFGKFNNPDFYLYCPNIFTFTPEAGRSYVVEYDLIKSGGRAFSCRVHVFDEENPMTPVQVISRSKPIQWTRNSPQCDKDDLENIKLKLLSAERFTYGNQM